MQCPDLEGFRETRTIGSGACGTVYQALDADALPVIVKVFQGTSINRNLLQKSSERLETGSWPRGVMPIIFSAFHGRPSLRITEAYFAENGSTNSLQHRLAEHPNPSSWELVRELAAALAQMHNRQVAHGNLKPGNVFFSASGEIVLSDWCLGLMPDVSYIEYSDAFLYAPPEQLLHAAGYYDEAGYRWDVFAFAVLSFRLLTGAFPRCDSTFSQVAPLAGEDKRDGVIADTAKIAESLLQEPTVQWTDEARDEKENEYRNLLLRCMQLEPSERPATMAEVFRGFEEIDQRIAAQHVVAVAQEHKRISLRATRRWQAIAAALVASVAFLSYMWNDVSSQFRQQKQQWKSDSATLQSDLARTSDEKSAIEVALQQQTDKLKRSEDAALLALRNSKEQWAALLKASRENSDMLFAMVFDPMEHHHADEQSRALRLNTLEKNLRNDVSRLGGIAKPNEEYARMTLQLAEIALFAKDSKKATSSFTEALAAWHTLEKSPSQQMRLAANQLLLAMLQQSQGEKQASASYLMARKALDEVPQEKVNRDHLTLLKAMLNYREAQNHSAAGEYAKALDQLRAATRQFHELITARPDVARLRSELSECFLASANVLESMNDFGNAREVRALAVIEINKLIKSHPNDIAVQLTLCETYTAMAHAALIAGDSLSVDQLSENAITILKKVLSQEPQNFIAATKLAAQHYFRATLHEDIGDAAKAISSVDDGLKLLEFAEMAEVSPDAQNTDALPRYYRALLLWQKGRLLGGNSRVQESALQNEALEILRNLKTNQQHPQLRSEHILMNLAQLLSDMAHVSHIDQKKDSAKEFFLAAAKEWETLAKLQPDNIDYRNAADWCRERIKEL